MHAVIVDEVLATKLQTMREPVEILTREGNRLGFFVPGPALKYNFDPDISDEEAQIQQRKVESRTRAQIMSDLDRLS